ncbi:MAG: GNAT family N-acetyltransferase [Gemmatimonas sp.]
MSAGRIRRSVADVAHLSQQPGYCAFYDMQIARTERLTIRHFTDADAAFVLALVNDPDWLRFIGDRNVHTLDDARTYIRNAIATYDRLGFGLYVVTRVDVHAEPLGIAGFVKRSGLDACDLGFAFLPDARGQGFALEACRALLRMAPQLLRPVRPPVAAADDTQLDGTLRILAITTPDNVASIQLLERLGLQFEKDLALTESEPLLRLFAIELSDN